MTLQAVIDDKTKIPAGLESEYIEKDGKFVLNVEGMKSDDDFANYATALKKRFTDSASDLARNNGTGLDRAGVEDVIESAFKKFSLGAKPGGNGDGQVDGDVAQQLHDLQRNVASLKEENGSLIKERDTALDTSKNTTIRNALTEAATAAGAVPEGIHNLVNLTKSNFEISQDGTVVTKLDAGDGVSPNANPVDYFANIARNKAFRMFWPASKGAGAGGGDGMGGGGGDLTDANPWTKKGWNITKQGQLFKADKAEAERLMSAAGVKVGAIAGVR